MDNVPLSKNIAGIVTNQNVDDVYALYNKKNKKISTICNLENINKKVAIGKSLHFLVNSSKFTEFIQLNKNIVTNVESMHMC